MPQLYSGCYKDLWIFASVGTKDELIQMRASTYDISLNANSLHLSQKEVANVFDNAHLAQSTSYWTGTKNIFE